jgi:hypothetical protein
LDISSLALLQNLIEKLNKSVEEVRAVHEQQTRRMVDITSSIHTISQILQTTVELHEITPFDTKNEDSTERDKTSNPFHSLGSTSLLSPGPVHREAQIDQVGRVALDDDRPTAYSPVAITTENLRSSREDDDAPTVQRWRHNVQPSSLFEDAQPVLRDPKESSNRVSQARHRNDEDSAYDYPSTKGSDLNDEEEQEASDQEEIPEETACKSFRFPPSLPRPTLRASASFWRALPLRFNSLCRGSSSSVCV